eukprot:7510124-Alexandrium_andersonii.AAC.1
MDTFENLKAELSWVPLLNPPAAGEPATFTEPPELPTYGFGPGQDVRVAAEDLKLSLIHI